MDEHKDAVRKLVIDLPEKLDTVEVLGTVLILGEYVYVYSICVNRSVEMLSSLVLPIYT